MPPSIDSLRSGLHSMSMSMPTTHSLLEEVTTIFVVGFPEDFHEREFQNMFLFSSGFEAATLKLPSKDQVDENGRRQIIGFAKFRTRLEAMNAVDVLNGRKVDGDKGFVLKAEMAKKNLHMKRADTSLASAGASNLQMISSPTTRRFPSCYEAFYSVPPSSADYGASSRSIPPSLTILPKPTPLDAPSGANTLGEPIAGSSFPIMSSLMGDAGDDATLTARDVHIGSLLSACPFPSKSSVREDAAPIPILPSLFSSLSLTSHGMSSSSGGGGNGSGTGTNTSTPTTTTSNMNINVTSHSNHSNHTGDHGPLPPLSPPSHALASPIYRNAGLAGASNNPADQNPPCNTLYVGNLPPQSSQDELRAMFSACVGYKRLSFRNKVGGPMCFVEFDDVSCATQALTDLQGTPLSNSIKGGIRLSYSKNPLGVRSMSSATFPTIHGRSLLYPSVLTPHLYDMASQLGES